MFENNMNRRGFFSTIAKVVGVAVVAPSVLSSVAQAQAKRGAAPAAGGPALVDPNDTVAKAVKYVEDAKKSKDSKGNSCATCGFYTKSKDPVNGKEVGACTIFAGKVVYAGAWCSSWNKKA